MLSRFSRVRLCATPETAAHQAPLSLGFSRQELWCGLPFPSHIYTIVYQIASGNLLYSTGSSAWCSRWPKWGLMEGRWAGGSRGKIYVYKELIHLAVKQKLTQHCKETILQLKKKLGAPNIFQLLNKVLGTQKIYKVLSCFSRFFIILFSFSHIFLSLILLQGKLLLGNRTSKPGPVLITVFWVDLVKEQSDYLTFQKDWKIYDLKISFKRQISFDVAFIKLYPFQNTTVQNKIIINI